MGTMFMEQLNETLLNSNGNKMRTENGAVAWRSTGKALLDMNFAVSSMRQWSDKQIIDKFLGAYAENPHLAIVWLFMARDIRGNGMGERNLFRVCLRDMCQNRTKIASALLGLVSEYGRWDDLIYAAIDTPCENQMFSIVKTQIVEDIKNAKSNKPFSLLAKWMPSENTSSYKTRMAAVKIRKALDLTPRQYQRMLSSLRGKLRIVERKMSANEWDGINYETVPSRANLNYNDAFLRHDEERRRKYLGALEKGEAKINSAAVFPHDIVHKYAVQKGWSMEVKKYDPALEGMWKSLPDYVNGAGDTMVVADGSGSMTAAAGKNSTVTALDVANALAIYFSEHMSGPYKNRYVTFSSRPQYVVFNDNMTLRDKLKEAYKHDECSNTNIQATFDLILKVAVDHELKQEELPKNVLIVSDMEFDCATTDYQGHYGRPSKTLFDNITKSYEEHGYKVPRLVFWNVCSRTGAIPVKENDLGVALVSGFSPAIANMVLSGKTDPYEALIDALNDKRYQPVHKALNDIGI